MPKHDPTPPWLSIIIPTLNEAGTLDACLDRIYAGGATLPFEVILSDGGSTDSTLEIRTQYPALTILHSTCGRALQLNFGAKHARGQYLWFLHADTLPPKDWWQHLQYAAATGLPASFSVRFSLQENSALLRLYASGSRLDHWTVRFGDQSLFVSAKAFHHAGGYRPDYCLMEGHELARRLQKTVGLQLLPAAVMTSSRRYYKYGVLYTQAIFTLIFSLHYLGVSQRNLVKIYRKAFESS